MKTLSAKLRTVLDATVPPVVATALAEAELPWVPDAPDAYCPRCGLSTPPELGVDADGCPACRGQRFPWQRLTRLSAYGEPVNTWLRDMKFHGQWAWARWLGDQLADALPEPAGPGDVWVTAVPMPWLRRWWRGYNQSQLIAEALCAKRGWRYAPLLRRTRYTPPQTAIVPSQRPQNIRNSFAVEPVDLHGCRIVLVDDIKTTGSTLRACARLLQQSGAKHLHAAVGAVAEPKSHHAGT